MAWSVSFEPRALKELSKLDRNVQCRIVKFLQAQVEKASDPRRTGKPLRGQEVEIWRFRIGDYRVLCYLNDAQQQALVLRIGHRKEIYR